MSAKKKAVRVKPFVCVSTFMELLVDYDDCVRADEMKGGGDPIDIPEIEANLAKSRARIEAFILRLKREVEGP